MYEMKKGAISPFLKRFQQALRLLYWKRHAFKHFFHFFVIFQHHSLLNLVLGQVRRKTLNEVVHITS